MHTGVVKFFNEKKGFGFIIADEGGESLFVHFSNIAGDGFKTLADGQRVSYVPEKGAKGMQATQVRVIE